MCSKLYEVYLGARWICIRPGLCPLDTCSPEFGEKVWKIQKHKQISVRPFTVGLWHNHLDSLEEEEILLIKEI